MKIGYGICSTIDESSGFMNNSGIDNYKSIFLCGLCTAFCILQYIVIAADWWVGWTLWILQCFWSHCRWHIFRGWLNWTIQLDYQAFAGDLHERKTKLYKPRTQMTSNFEGQPLKTRLSPSKTRVIYGFHLAMKFQGRPIFGRFVEPFKAWRFCAWYVWRGSCASFGWCASFPSCGRLGETRNGGWIDGGWIDGGSSVSGCKWITDRWWQLKDFWNVHPENWGKFPIWRAYSSKGLKPPTR